MADDTVATPRVLDPCCGSRMWWFDRQHPDAIYGDRRQETITVTDRSHGNADGTRTLHIQPDQLMDFRALPFPDGTFRLVAFDPPHLVRAGPRSWLAAKYGKLGQDWRDDLRQGFAECFRVLAPDGVLVFKWNETQVRIAEVLALTPHRPLFGNTSGKKAGTHWMVFMKPEASAASAPGVGGLGDGAERRVEAAAAGLRWCHHCGEGVTDFCRGKSRLCPNGLLVPHRNAGVGEVPRGDD